MPIVGQFGSLAGLGSLILPGGAMESIATVTVGSGGASSITFSDIPGGFQHLQIRAVTRDNRASVSINNIAARVNGDTGSNYADHTLLGDGASAVAAANSSISETYVGLSGASSAAASIFGASVVDILDYASTTKNKTIRSFHGVDANGSGSVRLRSALWASTSAITSVLLYPSSSGSFVEHSTFALYGVRA